MSNYLTGFRKKYPLPNPKVKETWDYVWPEISSKYLLYVTFGSTAKKNCTKKFKVVQLLQSLLFKTFGDRWQNFDPFWPPNSAKIGPNNVNFLRNLHCVEFHLIFKGITYSIISAPLVQIQQVQKKIFISFRSLEGVFR